MSLLDQNLAALAPSVADQIGGDTGEGHCKKSSRSGHTVTGRVIEGTRRYFHSIYDPIREAERLAKPVTAESIICIGFGSGLHIAPLRSRCSNLLIIEPDTASLTFALTHLDLSTSLNDPAVQLIVGDEVDQIEQTLPRCYYPAIHGSVSIVVLPGWTDAQPERSAALTRRVTTALSQISDDFATQARFGRAWVRNTVFNLATLQSVVRPVLNGHVVVTAAGPSLLKQLGIVKSADWILATDTSLPSLVAAGVVPDTVMTVDCQHTSYLHYLTAESPGTLLLADLAASPTVFRGSVHPVLSAHPLHQVLHHLGVPLSSYDSSGGNVTHAAVSAAVMLGAGSVTVVGADMAYPESDPYARGSYVHSWFSRLSSKVAPLAGELYRFTARRGCYPDPDDPGTIRHPTMDIYAARLASLAEASAVPVVITSEDSGDVTSPGRDQRARPTESKMNGAQALRKLLSWYESEPLSEHPAPPFSAVELSLLPLAAWHRRADPESTTGLNEAREETTRMIQTALDQVR